MVDKHKQVIKQAESNIAACAGHRDCSLRLLSYFNCGCNRKFVFI